MNRMHVLAWLVLIPPALLGRAGVGEVRGRVAMPDVCSPEVSPAVVVLEPAGGSGAPATSAKAEPAEVALVHQRGLQFVPRVRVVTLGRTIRFTNDDNEPHNVHVVSAGKQFNRSMAPAKHEDFTPDKPGVVRLACDVHSHMRGYVVVSASPWARVCSAKGNFRLEDVPDGKYTLTVWHEMGDPVRRDVTVEGGEDLDLGTLTVTANLPKVAPGRSEPARPWADVIDRIGVRLASAVDAAGKPNGFKAARRLAEDAYWVDFESSMMETAVRGHLGFARASGLERRFRAVVPALKTIADGGGSASTAVGVTRPLLLELSHAAGELDKKGVTDADHLRATAGAKAEAQPVSLSAGGDPGAQIPALREGFDRVAQLAEQGEADDAASAMTETYWGAFEPMERFINARRPGDVRPLEDRFNTIRGEVGAGLKGGALAGRLDGLRAEVDAALARSRAQADGAFAPAFVTSMVTAVREGVEVILLLAMLVAFAAKAGQASALRAIGLGVGLAVLASAATAVALNLLVASSQGRTREILEGGVMLAAAGVLFYVSYWLISQSESKRWTNYLKRQVARGVAPGSERKGRFALTLTAFLAVYREGAETALMYQALIGSQNGARAGLTGLAAGAAVAALVLAAFAYVIRAGSLRLPLRTFFQVTGGVLFAMAVVFAGNGIYELQSSGVLKLTPLTWLGAGAPLLGVHPNVQALSVQGLLLAGAGLALVVMASGRDEGAPAPRAKSTAGVGV